MSKESETTKELTPLMRQYWDVKEQNPDCLLFFRMGDFYEMFDSDAQVAARELDITLTSRPEAAYPGGRIPMAGVPVRSCDLYLAKLLAKGYSVAICEQVGPVGVTRGPMERKVARIFTPGTIIETDLLPSRQNNYLAAIVRGGDLWGLAYVDASVGEFACCQLTEQELCLELSRLNPSEVLVASRVVKPGPNQVVPHEVLDAPKGAETQFRLVGRPAMFFQVEPSRRRIMELFKITTLEGFGLQSMPAATSAAGAIIEYLQRTQAAEMPQFPGIATYFPGGHLIMDANTKRNLELTETVRERSFAGSLLSVLDKTKTAMGGRLLRSWLLKPLYSVPEISQRQKAVGELLSDQNRASVVEDSLDRVSDLERLAMKLRSATVGPKDLVAIGQSLAVLPSVGEALAGTESEFLNVLSKMPFALVELGEKIRSAIFDDAPRELTEGGIFNSGFSPELDEIRSLLSGGRDWIEKFQLQEQERTGIKSLKVSFNNNFGYYIEVTHANKGAVPEDYIRKQTLTNAERYITPELKEYEAKILNAEKNQSTLEYKLFVEFRQGLSGFGDHLLKAARDLAALDSLLSLAKVARERRYICPQVDDSLTLEIVGGRHPVLESILPMGKFVANDTKLIGASQENQLIILTGPNMSGKSSLLRQNAHIVILAQMGSYVPAEKAQIGLCDRIFTRIGAVDDLTAGQSTFLVEMSETTECCLSATERSLILLDEVGRGTSTYDGVAIAWSVAEFLARDVKARTIFATHYHELNGLANFLPQIANFQVLVKETEGQVEFLRKVVPGGASRSFGIQVAKMSGLPEQIISRAQVLMNQMERKSAASKILDGPKVRTVDLGDVSQLSIFSPSGGQEVLT